jgi:ATP-dependent protease ClpP protease subunit
MRSLPDLIQLADRARALAFRNAADLNPGNNSAQGWYRVTGQADERAQVYVYDTIGWDTPASEFVKELAAITAPTIDLRVNSPGGLVWDGLDIYSALKGHPARVEAAITGVAASAASVVVMAADHIAIEQAGRMMIHRSSGLVIGNMHDLRETADVLEGIDQSAAEIYQARAGGEVGAWLAAMDKTTWYPGQKAVDANLADAVIGNKTKDSPPPAEERATQLIRARARALALAHRKG